MHIERDRNQIRKRNSGMDQNILPLRSVTVTDGFNSDPPEENERLKSLFMTCFIEVHLSSLHSKIYVIHTPVRFFVLLIKPRVKNKNKIFFKSLGIVKDSDLSLRKFTSTQWENLEKKKNRSHFRTLFE